MNPVTITDFTTLIAASAVLIPIVMGVVQLIKKAGVSSAYAGLLAVVLGVAAEFLAVGTVISSPSVGVTVLLGVGVGLSAAGVYSSSKSFGEAASKGQL